MTAVGYVVKTLTVKLTPPGGTETAYECAVTGVQDAPDRATSTTAVACPDGSITDVGPASWTVTVNYNAVDTVGSFHRMLRQYDGQPATLEVEYDPVGEPGLLTSYDVTLVAGSNDATVSAFRTGTVTLPVKGAPVYTDPV